jgi:SAM-dependent methyltransferase
MAWGARSLDWAHLAEISARDVYLHVLDETSVQRGVSVLDIACGAGLALAMAASRGARVAGIDASERLLAVAKCRTPDADLRRGDMRNLPWPENSFDVITSFNGVWATNQDVIHEAARVLRPKGRLALAFFANGGQLDFLVPLITLTALMPAAEGQENASLLDIARPGVAEDMLDHAGLTATHRGRARATAEWPTADIAWRAVAATGLTSAVLAQHAEEEVRTAVQDALADFWDPNCGYRLVTEYDFVISSPT